MDNREISAASGNRKRKTALKSGRTKTKPTEPNTEPNKETKYSTREDKIRYIGDWQIKQ